MHTIYFQVIYGVGYLNLRSTNYPQQISINTFSEGTHNQSKWNFEIIISSHFDEIDSKHDHIVLFSENHSEHKALDIDSQENDQMVSEQANSLQSLQVTDGANSQPNTEAESSVQTE